MAAYACPHGAMPHRATYRQTGPSHGVHALWFWEREAGEVDQRSCVRNERESHPFPPRPVAAVRAGEAGARCAHSGSARCIAESCTGASCPWSRAGCVCACPPSPAQAVIDSVNVYIHTCVCDTLTPPPPPTILQAHLPTLNPVLSGHNIIPSGPLASPLALLLIHTLLSEDAQLHVAKPILKPPPQTATVSLKPVLCAGAAAATRSQTEM